MKSIFSNKKLWLTFILFLLAITGIGIATTLAKYTTVKDVGSFDLVIDPSERAFAMYSADDDSLNFYYGVYPEEGEEYANKIATTVYNEHIEKIKYNCYFGKNDVLSGTIPSWIQDDTTVENVTKVNFDTSFKKARPVSISGWFWKFTKLQSIEGLENLDTSEVTNMRNLFYGCSSLKALDLSNFNTEKVTNMAYMFSGCSRLTALDLSNFNTSNVSDMTSMFFNCTNATNINVSNFDTSNVTGSKMTRMFMYCKALTTLDLSSFNTEEITDMTQMFDNCIALTSLNLSSFNTSKVTTMYYMFKSNYVLESLDLSSFDTKKVTSMERMFFECKEIETITVSDKFVTTKVDSSKEMFGSCSALKGGAGTIHDENYINKTYARIDGLNGEPGYFTYKGTTYKLTFNANEGENAPTDIVSITTTQEILAKTIPARAGYTFLGWDTNKEVGATNVTYKYVGDGFSQSFTFTEGTTSATLYAIWSNEKAEFPFSDQNLGGLTTAKFPFVTGMTWGAWISSDYNTWKENQFLEYGDISEAGLSDVIYYLAFEDFDTGEPMVLIDSNGNYVKKDDIIISTETYKLSTIGESVT